MKSSQEIKDFALKTLALEAEAIHKLKTRINDDFVRTVQLIYQSRGRVVVTGIGKSAIIANKIVATFNSTGTPALFMHAADAIHGDLGMIREDDIIICISKSGNTPEVKVLLPLLKQSGNTLVCIVGNTNSYLAQQADLVIDATVDAEACPHNLAPTTSTTAQLAIGDALAVCLLECREFSSEDFARYHPGGTLGKRLYLKVEDISRHNLAPQVSMEDDIKAVIFMISSGRLGATAVLENGTLKGVITDGDLRRMMEKTSDFDKLKAKDVMNASPKTIERSELAAEALNKMKSHNISQLLVTDGTAYAGIIHLHDLIREGII